MKATLIVGIASVALLSFLSGRSDGLERSLLRETAEPSRPMEAPNPCSLPANRNGTCGNLSWYNVCSGYIWIYGSFRDGEGFGVLFGGSEQPCIAEGNVLKRVITYYRNVYATYSDHWSVYLDRDSQGDGCPDGVIATTDQWDIGLRWNCWEPSITLPPALSHVIVRQVKVGSDTDRPRLATDGPYSAGCDPYGSPRSFYYGVNGAECRQWIGPTGRYDNFLMWLIVDGAIPNANTPNSWGRIKGLFR